ncbi:response regulator [Sulfurimonas aquatica]|uniref:Response regulator n=1 Tax=Sulfurimonas aquatica TaxID=2672570 RepID=A0A975GC91_9BACT|nr:response regulator transcription factor [Sulfurimonas aquatica]QSZ41375.1 response regulator [Sulfurimonas aquatica]
MEKKKSMYKLLYVEDETEVRRNYVEYLKRFFDTIYEAKDAQDALRIYKTKHPTILIIDINLPGMSGIEFLQKIRESDHTTRAIMLTANSDVETLLNASELKLTKYLVKPVSRSDLKSAIELAQEEIHNFSITSNTIIKMKDSYYWDQENKQLMHQDVVDTLTRKEIELLSLLFSNINKIFSSDDIIYELWYDSDEPRGDALKTLIKGLRRKLPEGTIKNVFGVGYKIEL